MSERGGRTINKPNSAKLFSLPPPPPSYYIHPSSLITTPHPPPPCLLLTNFPPPIHSLPVVLLHQLRRCLSEFRPVRLAHHLLCIRLSPQSGLVSSACWVDSLAVPPWIENRQETGRSRGGGKEEESKQDCSFFFAWIAVLARYSEPLDPVPSGNEENATTAADLLIARCCILDKRSLTMAGQRNSVEHFADIFGLEMGSSSGNPVMDQQAYWNNVLGSVESPDLRGYPMNHSDATIPYGNDAQQDGAFLGFWESGEASSSSSALNFGRSNNVKTEHLNISGALRIGERRLVAENNLSLDMDINVSINGNDPYDQSSDANYASQGPENYGGCDRSATNAQPTDLRLPPYRAFLYGASEQTDPFGSLNQSENPLGDFSLMPEGIDQRPGSSLSSRRLACKRKNIEGTNGQSSAGASTSVSHRNDFSFQTIASSSYNAAASVRSSSSENCLLVPSSNEDQLPVYGTNNAGPSSGSYDSSGGINNAGNAHRIVLPRTTTAQQIAPCSVWPPSSTTRFQNSWNVQAPHLQSTFDEPQEVILPVVSSLNLRQHPVNIVVPQAANHFTGHRASSSRAGSLDNRILGSEEVIRRNVVPTSFSDLLPPASVEMRRLVPEPSDWSSDGRGTAISGNAPHVSRANTNSAANPPAGFIQQNLNRRHPRNLSEEIGRLSGALRAHQAPRIRPGYPLEREGEGVWGVPLSMRSREGRRLMEIRNALQMIHRGENVRLESIFYGGVDIHDRHRDMRLDIDNMSYEELLALEERIGNVNTGLGEETVTKLLKQRKFSSWRLKASSDHEPCCICQEEYVDGDDLGRLDCGHDFHAGCIRQWLLRKNLCPICKNTALKT